MRFHLKHLDAILDHCPSVRYITPADGMYGTIIKQGARLKAGNVFGVNVEAASIFKLDVERGRFLQPDDLKYNRRVIVLGADLKEALFPPGAGAIGQKVKTRGISFEVIGALRKKGETLVDWGGQEDEKAYIPITAFLQNFRGSKYIRNIMVQPKDPAQSAACVEELRITLAKELDFSPDDKEAIEFIDIAGILRSVETMTLITAISVTIIGVITLLVGGIGVMNIMLISVTERTREIGIRKAIGAKRRHILLQFLAEALTITLLSGIIGIALGCAVCLGFAAAPRPKILGTPEISLLTMSVSVLTMVVVGVLAGVLPAYRAAGLDPVECLRYE